MPSKDVPWEQVDPHSSMSVAKRVSFAMPSLRASERKVASHLAAHPLEAATSSTEHLAVEVGVSDTSVIRAARALGYAGFSDLKSALLRDVSRFSASPGLRNLDAPTDTADYLSRLHATATRTTDEMFQRLDYAVLDRAATILTDSTSTFVYGVGVSNPAAEYLATRLGRIGVDARSLPGTGFEFADSLNLIREKGSVILLAPGALHKEMLVLLDRCDELRCPVILLSDTLGPMLEQRVDVWLWTPFPDQGPLSEMFTMTQMVDIIVDVASRAVPGRTLASRRKLHSFRSQLRLEL